MRNLCLVMKSVRALIMDHSSPIACLNLGLNRHLPHSFLDFRQMSCMSAAGRLGYAIMLLIGMLLPDFGKLVLVFNPCTFSACKLVMLFTGCFHGGMDLHIVPHRLLQSFVWTAHAAAAQSCILSAEFACTGAAKSVRPQNRQTFRQSNLKHRTPMPRYCCHCPTAQQ